MTYQDPNPRCPACRGAGVVDSGGMMPWGEWVQVRCLCTYPALDEPVATTYGLLAGGRRKGP